MTVLERTNLRYIDLAALPDQAPVQLATLDLSFISVLKVQGSCASYPDIARDACATLPSNFNVSAVGAQVLPAVCSVLTPDASLIVLIKPQFEAGRGEVGAHACQCLTALCDACVIVCCCRGRNDGRKSWMVQVSSGGIVKDERVHKRVIEDVTAGIEAAGFAAHGWMESPLKGAVGGNSEFLAYFTRIQHTADATLGS